MDKITVILAKLAGLQKVLNERLEGDERYFDPQSVINYFERFNSLRNQLIAELPELYYDLPERTIPVSSGNMENNGRGYIDLTSMRTLKRDLDYIFEVKANSRIGENKTKELKREFIFISHGSSK
ncbi:MAG: hypothetical protein KAU01_01720 [Candidatus Cloacimonetes bacterium]|nr:hypothetical protein [Candidatus Cloacimonadota bacterium]